MRNDIPANLYQSLINPGVRPIYYLIFHFSDHDRYVSDSPYVTDTGITCESLVTDWGSFVTSVALDSTVKAITVPNTELSVTIANTESTGWFCNEINLSPIENIEVDLYLTSDKSGDKILIERFIVTDPISYRESDNTVQITMVSKILSQQQFVGAIDPATNEFYPLVIGAASVVEGQPYGNQTFAQITAEIGTSTTTITTDRNLTTAGFPASGTLSLGHDTCTYTGISGNNFTGVSGVSETLPSDSYICLLNNNITFAYGTGPVEIASPLYVNGEIYTYPATILKNENPVKVVFPNSLPYSIIPRDFSSHTINENYLQILESEWTIVYNICLIAQVFNQTYIRFDNIINVVSPFDTWKYAAKKVFKIANNDYGLPANAIFKSATFNIKFVNFSKLESSVHYKGDVSTGVYFGGNETYFTTTTGVNEYFNETLVITDYNDFKDNVMSFIVFYRGFQPKGTSFPNFSIWKMEEVNITIAYEIENSPEKKIYTVTTSLNIGSSIGSVNPAISIQSMINFQEPTLEIDTASFTNAYNWFDNNGYEFEGIIDGGKTYGEVIKDMLLQSRSYIYFVGNKVYIDISKNPLESTVKLLSTVDSRFDKSISIERQPLSDVTNKLILRYNYDSVNDEYLDSYQIQDNDSIAKIKIHEELIDCYLVKSQVHAEDLADYYLEDRSQPKTIIEIAETYNKMNVTIGDVIMVRTDFSNIGLFFGKVVRISKQYVNESTVSKFIFTLVGVLKPATFFEYNISENTGMQHYGNEAIALGWNKTPWNKSKWNH